MSERVSQIILYVFASVVLFLGYDMTHANSPWHGIGVYGLAIFLMIWTSVGPSTIKTFFAKWGAEGGQIGFDRHQATEAEQDLAVKLAQDNPPAEIEEEGQKFIKTAEQRSPEKRSAEDCLALATGKWRIKDYEAALEDVYSGLALQPENIRIKATLIHRKASIFEGLGLSEQAEELYKEATQVDAQFSMPSNNLGILYKNQKKLEEAKKQFEAVLKIDPDSAKAKIMLERVIKEMK